MPRVLIFGDRPIDFISTSSKEKVDVIVSRNLERTKKRISYETFVMIIIDLENNVENGIQLAEFIRNSPIQRATPIVFISKNHNNEQAAFHDYHCYDYFIKPLSPRDIIKIMYLCQFKVDKDRFRRLVVFQIRTERYPVRINDILYIEKLSRKVIVHTVSGKFYVSTLSLSDLVCEYTPDFVRIHRSVIVNKNHVNSIIPAESKLLMNHTDDELFIGRTFLKKVRESFD